MIVADTNLIAYLYLPNPQTELAERLLAKDADWFAPPLWRGEFRNVLAQQMRHGNLELEHALTTMATAESMMQRNEYTVASAQVLSIVAGTKCSAYDGEFVALARELQARLVTFDQKLVRQFPEIAISPEIYLA